MFNARLLEELLAALYRISSSDLKKLLVGSIYESLFYLSVMNHQISLIILCLKVLLEFFVNIFCVWSGSNCNSDWQLMYSKY